MELKAFMKPFTRFRKKTKTTIAKQIYGNAMRNIIPKLRPAQIPYSPRLAASSATALHIAH